MIYGKTLEEWEELRKNFVYTPIDFKDRIVEHPKTFKEEITGQDGEHPIVTLTPAPGQVFESGTPLNAAMIGKMDMAIYLLYKLQEDTGEEIENRARVFDESLLELRQTLESYVLENVAEMRKLLDGQAADMQKIRDNLGLIQAMIDANLEGIAALNQLIRYENGVLKVGASGALFQMSMDDDGMAIGSASNAIRLSKTQVEILNLKVTGSVQFGNHIAEKHGKYGTLIKVVK